MATSLLLLVKVGTLCFFFLLPIFESSGANILTFNDGDEDSDQYVLESPLSLDSMGSLRGRRLATEQVKAIKRGAQCSNVTASSNICNGVWASRGKRRTYLHCCKNHCRDTLGDRNHCGMCGQKCRFGQMCCGGTCTNIGFNSSHCGKCFNACEPGVQCEYGVCGYA